LKNHKNRSSTDVSDWLFYVFTRFVRNALCANTIAVVVVAAAADVADARTMMQRGLMP